MSSAYIVILLDEIEFATSSMSSLLALSCRARINTGMIPTAESALLRLWPPSCNSPEPHNVDPSNHGFQLYRRAWGTPALPTHAVIQSVFYTPSLWKTISDPNGGEIKF